jgi:type VI secretion system secreted protein VgrG
MPDDPKITYSQTERLLQIKTSDGVTELLLEKFSGAEILSKPFEFKVTLLSAENDVDLKSLLRTDVTVTMYLADGTPRYFNAVFLRLTQAKEAKEEEGKTTGAVSNPSRELAVYEGVIVPKLWFLSLKTDCKIFQNLSVPDIVSKVLDDAGISDYQFHTYGTYPARDYCVQYRESNLAFISRLLEEEGIYYFFSHQETKHTIIFGDKNTVGGACPGQETVEYSSDREGWVGKGEEGIASLERTEQAHTGKVALTDYNFETPNLSLMSTLADDNEEHYDYPGEYGTVSEGERYARVRLEEVESLQFVVTGSSRCRSFRPGYTFKLIGHFRTDTNQEYFLTTVTHDALDSTYRQGKGQAHHYRNTFKAIPKTIPFRPERVTERPTVHGLQPALVVGKLGEEIWVDKYGRVKVQFYWDRDGKKNENSSCWCRVSQIWAGKNWGWITIPRIGQEVLVDFLEGNPDQPIIVGRVYNADQTVPYALPANQTQSGIKSRSSKGGTADNYNEIQFEDLKGEEKLNVHAEKDMTTVVEHDDTQHVMNNRIINVDGTHTETIIKDTSITITEGNHSLEIQTGNQTITLDKGNQTTTLDMGNQTTSLAMGNQSTTLDMGSKTTTVSLGSIMFEAMESITLTVGGSSIVIDQMGVTISGMMIEISGDAMTTVSGDAMLTLEGGITMIN